jgi:hypothetical protein
VRTILALAGTAALAMPAAAGTPLAGTFRTTIPKAAADTIRGTWTLTIQASGRYTFRQNDSPVRTGRATITKTTISFGHERGNGACTGSVAKGIWAWKLQGKTLRFTDITERCPERWFVLTHVFTRVT